MATEPCTNADCPPDGDLSRLIRGRLPASKSSTLTEHVGSCPGCQQRMDDLAGDAGHRLTTVLRDPELAGPPQDSAMWKALAVAEAEVTTTQVFANGAAKTAAEVKLDFLQPATTPGRLGRLGRFEIIRVVGQGGMGIVLHGFDPDLQRDVAVKVIDPELADNEVARQRFCREARAAAAVSHDNLVAVHQVDEDEDSGLPYLVMQLVNGESLEQRLRRTGTMKPGEVGRLGMKAAAGLAAAHDIGLIHRDIKPANILLEAPGDQVKLTDFGLARATEDMKLTRTGFVAGSPLYMAPEQARGEEVDARADLFSLGTVLYEAATGKPPFDAKTPLAVLKRIADEQHPPLKSVNPDVPDWLSDAVDRLLAKNPADRFQSARDVADLFAAELARWYAISPLDVPADVCPARSATTKRAKQGICWKYVLGRTVPWVGGAVLGGLLVGLWPSSPSSTIHTEPPATGGTPVAGVAAIDPGPPPKAELNGDAGPVWGVGFIPNSDLLVMGMEDGSTKIYDWKRNTVVKTLDRLNGNIWTVDVSPDGKFLVTVCDDSSVPMWDLKAYRRTGIAFPQQTSAKSAAFSPDGKFVATGDRNSTIRMWDLATQIPTELHGHRGVVHALAYNPAGTKLVSAGGDGVVRVWHTSASATPSKDPVQELTEHKGPVYGVAFSPNGHTIASAGWDGTVRIWDAKNGTQRHILRGHDGDVWSVSFGGGGKYVASAGNDGTVRVWDVETGAEVQAFRGSGKPFHAVRFAPDGVTLAAGSRDGKVRVWEVAGK